MMPAGNRSTQYLTFDVAASRYAISTTRVHAILEHRTVTPVPGSSTFVAGVFNHAGTVTPVVDLAARLGMGDTAVTKRTCLILVGADHGGDQLPIALMVSSVHDVVDIERDAIHPPPDFGVGVPLDYLEGLAHASHGFTIVFDVDRFLTAEELLEISGHRNAEIERHN